MKEPWEEGRPPDAINDVGTEFYILPNETKALIMNDTTRKPIKGMERSLVLRTRRGDRCSYIITDKRGMVVKDETLYENIFRAINAVRQSYAKRK